MALLRTLGKLPSGEELKEIEASPHYYKGVFNNLTPTKTLEEGNNFFKVLWQFINKPASCFPSKPLPSVRTDLKKLPQEKPVIVWFGHSSYLIHINNKNILVDPVFSGHASPFSFTTKAFPGTNLYGVDDMPEIDILLITHDHYDHLDYETVVKLQPKVKQVCTSLGVASHLVYWGYNKNIITEFDWWDSKAITDGITLTAAPARHFSGRSFRRNKTLWSSYILKTPEYNLYLGGDSGYGKHFKTIGDVYGPFDIAILECGQYNLAWPHIHMLPHEVPQAAIDLKANIFMPVHWSKFSLSLHPWNEPPTIATAKAKELNMPYTTPEIGQPVIIGEDYPVERWWEEPGSL